MSKETKTYSNSEFQTPVNRTRRAIFVFGFTLLFGLSGILIGWFGTPSSAIASQAVEGCFGIVQLIVVYYLATSTIDRSEVLTNVGKGVKKMGERRTMTPDEMRRMMDESNEEAPTEEAKG